LLSDIVKWKNFKKISDDDGDQVWCVFDVDDFYQNNSKELLAAVKNARNNNVKIACSNECFELWFLLHFEKPNYPTSRGKYIEKKISAAFENAGFGKFKKNQNVFQTLCVRQSQAIINARKLLPQKYSKIDWQKFLQKGSDPVTSVHFLVEEINRLAKKFPSFQK
jgi:hypothetical protein